MCSSKHRQAKVALGMRVPRFPLHLPPESLTRPKTAFLSMALVMHQSIPPAPSRNPELLRGICPPCQSRWWGICKFCTARGPGICQPRGHSRAFDTHTVSYQSSSVNDTSDTGHPVRTLVPVSHANLWGLAHFRGQI